MLMIDRGIYMKLCYLYTYCTGS